MPPSFNKRRFITGGAVITLLLTVVLFLVFAAGNESVTAAPDGRSEECASVVSELPRSVMGKEKRETTAVGTAAWGDGGIVLRCGVTPLNPTINLCMTVDGVDWVLDEAKAKNGGPRTLTTYGRHPAIEVTVKDSDLSPGGVLVDLNRAVKQIPQGDHKCL
ncbi:DUF3515 domain-containing protein [Streptomyces sp. GC420]|uniref:DUF3515 domain-containing protein n=1 Tax=Streptomyces sp. GC420 TaxID=2697568 RepID=UPI001414DBDD|nr:DUF3515 family protein [Streptomyces sp. GC420]